MVKDKHLFLVNSDKFDITYDETWHAIKLKLKEETRIEKSLKTGLICLSEFNYVFIQKDTTLPLISAPIDSGYLGDCTLITSRPITLPKGYEFHMFILEGCDGEKKIPKDMKLRKPAYKGDIGRDAYLKKSGKNTKDVQFILNNSKCNLFFPRSSAAKKGFEVHVTLEHTKVRKADMSLLYKEDAYSVVQHVSGTISKFKEPVEFLDDEQAEFLLKELTKKSHRGSKKEGSSDNLRG